MADCVQWLCYLVQLILAQWCLCLPVIIDHCIPTPDTHNHWDYILHHRSVINVIICKLLVTQNNRTPATVILVVGPRVVIWIFSGWIVMIVMTRLDTYLQQNVTSFTWTGAGLWGKLLSLRSSAISILDNTNLYQELTYFQPPVNFLIFSLKLLSDF